MQRFFIVGASAGAWGSRAYQLRLAAETLFRLYIRELDHLRIHGDAAVQRRTWKYRTLPQVILMLAGFAIENLAKALWVQKNKPQLAGRLPTELNSHERNIELLKSVGVQLSVEETSLISVLQKAAVWAGRYPIPKRAENMGLPRDISREEFDLFKDLYDRLNNKMVPRRSR